MAADRRLREDLLKKLGGVTASRMYQLAAELKANHGPMGTDDAVYVLAHQKGLDLTKYIDDKVAVDRIRGLVPRGNGPAPTPVPTKKAAPTPTGSRPSKLVRVGETGSAVELKLSAAVADEAARMAELYPKMYLLENSIRSVINRVLTAKHGTDWWATQAPSAVRKLVQGRKDKEDKVPWHGKRGAHEIYYSDFSDLRNIIEKNWVDFDPIIHKQQWINQWLEELEPARNTLAHNNPVSENEQKRIEVFYADWAALIEANKTAIP
jgi:hypothetical protein